MRSSVLALIFIFLLTLVALNYSSHLLILKDGIDKSNLEAKKIISNKDYLTIIPYVLDKYKDKDFKTIETHLKKYGNQYITIELIELSSKINPNFVDFTLFKHKPLNTFLKEGYTWEDLYKYRLSHGILADISGYYKFFKDESDILTLYNLPNINNAADESLKNLYILHTQDEGKANSFRQDVLRNREKERIKILDNTNFESFFMMYQDSVKNVVTITPTWNVNYIDEKILRAIFNKFYTGKNQALSIAKINALLLGRENEYLTKDKLKRIITEEKVILTYLGDRTTFWQVNVSNSKSKLNSMFIFKWDGERYNLISLLEKEVG